MSTKDILAGTLFVFAATFTVMLVLAIGVMWWESFKDHRKKK